MQLGGKFILFKKWSCYIVSNKVKTLQTFNCILCLYCPLSFYSYFLLSKHYLCMYYLCEACCQGTCFNKCSKGRRERERNHLKSFLDFPSTDYEHRPTVVCRQSFEGQDHSSKLFTHLELKM